MFERKIKSNEIFFPLGTLQGGEGEGKIFFLLDCYQPYFFSWRARKSGSNGRVTIFSSAQSS
jgi:hypothetical protein